METGTFSNCLQLIVTQVKKGPVPLVTIMNALGGREHNLILIFLASPFCLPIPLPGFSLPFGVLIMSLGLGITVGKPLWIPKWASRYRIQGKFSIRLIEITAKTFFYAEKYLTPRLTYLTRGRSIHIFNGLFVITSGFLVLLPLPIPFHNTLPALSIVLLGAGNLEKDGVAIIVSYLIGAAGWSYFLLLYLVGKGSLKMITS